MYHSVGAKSLAEVSLPTYALGKSIASVSIFSYLGLVTSFLRVYHKPGGTNFSPRD